MTIYFFLGDISSKGGIERVTITLANALSKKFNVSIVSLYKSNSEIAFEINNNVNVIILSNQFEKSMYNRSPGGKGIIFDFKYIFSKLDVLKKRCNGINSEDIIVSCDIKMTLLLYFFCKKNRARLLAIEHFEHDIGNGILKRLRKIIYTRIDAVVSLTSEDKHKYLVWLDAKKHWVIPNIVVTNKKELTFSDTEKENTVLAVGRLTHQKGFDLLIKSWSLIENDGWILKIVGDGEEFDNLQKQVSQLNATNIELIPFQKNIHELYAKSKIFVLSSRFEGLGMVLLEALTYALPCISFDCPAGPKTILSNGSGLLVPTGNVDLLGTTISKLINDHELRKSLSLKSAKVLVNFSEDKIVKQWSEMICETKKQTLL
ncbi:glycosyltransferase family 4 protein [Enterobacter sp. CC120223-11]|uniref:glycosyltransferase family 4 protein n=1 Tax=Enterobacter sp. CC120223-11 TaxID=1378073 RepID=UPI000BD0FA8B|nr:glycosyltransferase family 4 protein [Enterobacter sp. CC120223-11]SNY64163.1 Glycosyltransferase involved in cell wall bisynthesis [Enterobacter sp. CC120223-11]